MALQSLTAWARSGASAMTRTTGSVIRLCQTGKGQFYVLVFLLGMTALIYWNIVVH